LLLSGVIGGTMAFLVARVWRRIQAEHV